MDDFPSVFKCDRRTIISKNGSAELHVVFNDGIETFAGSRWLDEKNEVGRNKRLQKTILKLLVRLAYTHRLNMEQKMHSRCKSFCRGGAEKKEIMRVRKKKGVLQRNPLSTRKISTGYWPWGKNLAAKNWEFRYWKLRKLLYEMDFSQFLPITNPI